MLSSRPGAAPEPAAGVEELRGLIEEYRGFGMFSLIRVLVFRGWRHWGLAALSVMLLIGQWAGPIGFIAFKLRMLGLGGCPGDGALWARFIITSVALIYTARLVLYALTHTLEVPEGFNAFKMPKWWTMYRMIDLVLESLVYDTAIFMFNLYIVFQDRSVADMIVDVLALEFFTMIDDEFKRAVLKFDISFLDDMVIGVQPSSTSATALLEEGEVLEGGDDAKKNGAGGCGAAMEQVGNPFLETILRAVRMFCRIVGPVFAFFMIFVGPYCLGMDQ